MVSSTPRPYFTPGKDPVPIVQEAVWGPGPVWTGGKSRLPQGFNPWRITIITFTKFIEKVMKKFSGKPCAEAKFLGVVRVSYDVTYQLLNAYHLFVKSREKMGTKQRN